MTRTHRQRALPDSEWGLALLRTQRLLRTTDYSTHVTHCGEAGAASGALSCALALQEGLARPAHPEWVLVFAGSEQGLRGAAVLRTMGGGVTSAAEARRSR